MLLEGDAIVLAGATGRVGGATLATLVAEGARVLVLSRSAERARRTIADILDDAERAAALPFAADLTDPALAAAAVDACVERFGRVDALVSLAGEGFGFRPLVDSSVDDLRKNVAAFTEVAYNLAVPALRAMSRSRIARARVRAGGSSSSRPAPRRTRRPGVACSGSRRPA